MKLIWYCRAATANLVCLTSCCQGWGVSGVTQRKISPEVWPSSCAWAGPECHSSPGPTRDQTWMATFNVVNQRLDWKDKDFANPFMFSPETNLFSGMRTSSCSGVTEYFLLAYYIFPDLSQDRFGSSISETQRELNLHFLHRVEVLGSVTSLWQISLVVKNIFL